MTSGIGVSSEIVEEWSKFKVQSSSTRYITMKMNDDMTEVVLDSKAADGAAYEDFVKYLNDTFPNEPRYAVVRFNYTMEDGGDREKLIFVLWAPDSSKIKPKMLYASTKDPVKKALQGIGIEVQATDAGEISAEEIEAKCKQISR